MRLCVKGLQGAGEARRVAVLLVVLDGGFDGFVGDAVALREVFGEDAGARLVFLGDVRVV